MTRPEQVKTHKAQKPKFQMIVKQKPAWQISSRTGSHESGPNLRIMAVMEERVRGMVEVGAGARINSPLARPLPQGDSNDDICQSSLTAKENVPLLHPHIVPNYQTNVSQTNNIFHI